MNRLNKKKVMEVLIVVVIVAFTMSITLMAFANDVPIEKGVVQEVGDNFVSVVIKNGNGFKDGTKLTFYTHKKTKISMAHSNTPLTLSSVLIGDLVEITLGKTEIAEDGKTVTRYADRIRVVGNRAKLKYKGIKRRKKLNN